VPAKGRAAFLPPERPGLARLPAGFRPAEAFRLVELLDRHDLLACQQRLPAAAVEEPDHELALAVAVEEKPQLLPRRHGDHDLAGLPGDRVLR
jgi:hypothetical protein